MRIREPESFKRFPRAALQQSIPNRFYSIVERFGDRPAVHTSDSMLSYRELRSLGLNLAHEILRRCPDPRQSVAILTNQGVSFVIAALAALIAGRTFVPLDPRMAVYRWRHACRATNCNVVLCDELNRIAANDLAFPVLPILTDTIDEVDAAGVNGCTGPATTAYVYYTSGSTGDAKGVLDCHLNILHNIMRYTNTLLICPDDRLSMVQFPSFSGCISSLLGALLNGACVCPFDLAEGGLKELPGWMRNCKISVYHSVPAIFQLLAGTGARYPDVRVVRLEGDLATARDVEIFNRCFPEHAILVNGLGATECGLVRQFFVARGADSGVGALPVGYPVPDVDVIITGEDNSELLPGDVGEVVVRSRYVACGYVGKTTLNEKRFITDSNGARIGYRTGDRGMVDPGGCLTILGRVGAEVRINGITVNLDAIEKSVIETRLVARALARTVETSSGPVLAVYCAPALRQHNNTGSLRALLSDALAWCEAPVRVRLVTEWPLTADGKVDADRLPGLVDDVRHNEPGSTVETRLVYLWRRLLRTAVSAGDNVFELGADSLLAARFVTCAGEEFGYEIDVRQVFESPSAKALARALRGNQSSGERSRRGTSRGKQMAVRMSETSNIRPGNGRIRR
jgi:acyl-CoA synthetase (AMP-forming)/AMP-acid ligase II